MPVEKKIDTNIDFSMDDLDEAAKQAEKALDKRLKDLERKRKQAEKKLSKSAIFGGKSNTVSSKVTGALPSKRVVDDRGFVDPTYEHPTRNLSFIDTPLSGFDPILPHKIKNKKKSSLPIFGWNPAGVLGDITPSGKAIPETETGDVFYEYSLDDSSIFSPRGSGHTLPYKKPKASSKSKSAIFGGLLEYGRSGALPSGKAIPERVSADPLYEQSTGRSALSPYIEDTGPVLPKGSKHRIDGKEVRNTFRAFPSLFDDILSDKYGLKSAQLFSNFITDPASAIYRVIHVAGPKAIAPLVVFFIIKEVIEVMQRRGGFLDRFFVKRLNDREDALRDKEQQATAVAGFLQSVITDRSGYHQPLQSYNTYEKFINDNERLEEDFTVRHTEGF